jgi:hypothetical protein
MAQAGGWWGLLDVREYARQEFDWWADNPPMACPICGEPLRQAPTADSGSDTQLYCNYAGDHTYHYPRDHVRPNRP